MRKSKKRELKKKEARNMKEGKRMRIRLLLTSLRNLINTFVSVATLLYFIILAKSNIQY